MRRRIQLPGSENLVAGQQVTLSTHRALFTGVVVSNDGTTIVFDTNHPMASGTLINVELSRLKSNPPLYGREGRGASASLH